MIVSYLIYICYQEIFKNLYEIFSTKMNSSGSVTDSKLCSVGLLSGYSFKFVSTLIHIQ